MACSVPPFFRLPRELRDKIYEPVLLDPAAPVFETNNDAKYRNYLGLMYVNKLVCEEAKSTLATFKPLIIVSCNIEHFGELLTDHAIPYISNHNAGKVRFHSLRLHVKFPQGDEDLKVLKAYVLLYSDLKKTCMLLRSLSLQIPHCPGQPVATDGSEFPRMQMAVRLEPSGEALLPTPQQVRLLKQMTWLNRIGKISFVGFSDVRGKTQHLLQIQYTNSPTVRTILPGHSERLPEPTSDILEMFVLRIKKFTRARYNDGLDAIKIAVWMNAIAARALRTKDFHVAQKRYFASMGFIDECVKQNMNMLSASEDFNDNVEEKLDIQYFKAEIGLTQSCIGLADWKEAAVHIKVVMEDLEGRSGISKEMKIVAGSLEQRIKEKLRAAHDKAKSGEEPTKDEKEEETGKRKIGLYVYPGSG